MSKKWRGTKNRWFNENPSVNGFYQCSYCGKPVGVESVTLDHILPQSQFPMFKHAVWNLRPTHELCNMKLGRLVSQPNYLMRMLRNSNNEHVRKALIETNKMYSRYAFVLPRQERGKDKS